MRDYSFGVAKTKGPIRCALNAQLICAFIFTLAKIQFSHDTAHMHSYRVSFIGVVKIVLTALIVPIMGFEPSQGGQVFLCKHT